MSHQYDQIKSFDLKEGRYFSEHESVSGPAIALIGSDISDALFPEQSPVGKEITVRGAKFDIIGVLKKEGSSLVGNSSDNQVIIPLNFARNLVNLRSDAMDPYFMVKAKADVSLPELRDDLRGAMRSIRKLKPREEDDFALNETSLLDKWHEGSIQYPWNCRMDHRWFFHSGWRIWHCQHHVCFCERTNKYNWYSKVIRF